MNPNSKATPASGGEKKPRVAYAIATVLGIGYLPPGPGTYGSLVGVATAMLSALFFLRPTALSLHPIQVTKLADTRSLPGANIYDSTLIWPIFGALVLLVFLVTIGVWSTTRVACYSGAEDPQYIVIDEVAGQHLTLLLPLIPLALPNLTTHFDFSVYAIFFALSLLNWKYLLLGFILFRVFDIWKPFPVRQLEKLPGGWGIMADDWMAGIYAAILLRLALHFRVL
ncbi:MAG TPA: phosphatidylglycerophosphatase A [Candidatus Dormibacteraeota bacterium]|nr:phosphatidylglycerophosphatase A [Candidatus Dormibacteraeota bacterium]